MTSQSDKDKTNDLKAIVFDLDNTLYPEADYLRSGFRAVADRLSGPGCPAEKIESLLHSAFQSGSRDRVFSRVLKRLGRQDDPQVIAELVGLYRCHRPCLTLRSFVKRTLEVLSKQYKLALITDGYLPAQQLKVESLGLESYFEPIIYTEQLGRSFWKPHPKAFQLLSQELDLAPEQCAYVATNSAKDFLAPNQLGWYTIQLNQPDRPQPDPGTDEHARARVSIDSLEQLLDLFG